MQTFKDFLINISLLTSFLFLYTRLYKRHPLGKIQLPMKIVMGASAGILGVILMNFSIQVTEETIIDLRNIPLILSVLYGGWLPGLITTVFIIVFRFLIGFNISSIAAAILIATMYIGFVLIKRKQMSLYNKTFWFTLYSCITSTIVFIYLIQDLFVLVRIVVLFWTSSFFAAFAMVYLLNYLRQSYALLKQYEEASTTDFLTGLGNVRQFDEMYNQVLQQTIEKKKELSFMMLDIDYFKRVNDTYGHKEGDEILKQISAILKYQARSFDFVSRNGGEEFSIVMPDTPVEKAKQLAERIRIEVEQNQFILTTEQSINITISIGISHYPTVQDPIHLIHFADQSLYKSKSAGRNCVTVYQSIENNINS
ncbi:hypothetical protein Q73_07135 [Bacillus coahuilensis m2-6]|uniref:GGDEF domain-containing protein n=1 Tax=Bacillus coahuilensis TaxID=408580 RepID=UPI0007502569|nr:diguanylate cyclase [Bacillus coahuilensis]KUP08132.1 hypothetical protein Q73_07135 [Bacillus coahuilensis m2-6]